MDWDKIYFWQEDMKIMYFILIFCFLICSCESSVIQQENKEIVKKESCTVNTQTGKRE